MKKGRLEAFSDGVLAIIITIMVLELKTPHGADVSALLELIPTLMGYLMSFVYIGIYWNNHHHLMHLVERVNGTILWANLHLLFWLSLVPFFTLWMDQNQSAVWPVVFYGLNLFMAGTAYFILSQRLIAEHGKSSPLARAIGQDFKGIVSLVVYLLAIGLAFFETRVSLGLYALVALMWLIPDRRIERVFKSA